MEIILLRRVEKLGQMGDIVSVKAGFARNYLIPQGYADRATKERITYFEKIKKQLEAQNLKERQEAETIAKKMDNLLVTFIRSAGETGNLYGSVRTQDIAQAITEAGYTVTKNQIHIEHPIKTIGIHTIYVVLHPEVKVPVQLNIAMSQAEAQAQLLAPIENSEQAEVSVSSSPKEKAKKKSSKKTEASLEENPEEPSSN